jgi:hypothetical protein
MQSKVNPGPAPTLGELQRGSSKWAWVYCESGSCHHRAPMAFAPLVIRWGPDASSDRLRRSARCTKCGHKGASLRHPSWVDMVVGVQPFPTDALVAD